jgi:integrase
MGDVTQRNAGRADGGGRGERSEVAAAPDAPRAVDRGKKPLTKWHPYPGINVRQLKNGRWRAIAIFRRRKIYIKRTFYQDAYLKVVDDAKVWLGNRQEEYRLTRLPPTYESLERKYIEDVLFWWRKKYINDVLDVVKPGKVPGWVIATVRQAAGKSPLFADIDVSKFSDDELERIHKNRIANLRNNEWMINAMIFDPFIKVSLAEFNERGTSVIDEYRDRRLFGNRPNGTEYDDPVEPSRVRREFSVLQVIFREAAKQPQFRGLTNHFRGYSIPNSTKQRDRTLEPGELTKLEDEIDRRYQRPGDARVRTETLLAVYLAIETGLRLQEIMNIAWSDVNLKDRTIVIRVGKQATKRTSKKGPVIVGLSILAEVFINALGNKDAYYIFSRTESGNTPSLAFTQRFIDIVKKAEIDDLIYKDLRHEAATYIHQATNMGDTGAQLGHENTDITPIYVDEKKGIIPVLLRKLDRDFLGMTLSEAGDRNLPNVDWDYIYTRWTNKGYSNIRCWCDPNFKCPKGKHRRGRVIYLEDSDEARNYNMHHDRTTALEHFMKYWLTDGNHLAKRQQRL